ncbi:MAG: 30S ribosomal protein S13, partial [Candidatus Peribacteraceae bacterium]|nr:30S ribosomal protein S13 [Candidatus Peribacteraceae bacterium]
MTKEEKNNTENEEKKENTAEKSKGRPPEKRVRTVIRLGETNINGDKIVQNALLDIKGISFSLSNIISKFSGLGNKKVVDLSEAEIAKIEDMITNPGKHKIPSWMFNRRKDMITGEDIHLSVS